MPDAIFEHPIPLWAGSTAAPGLPAPDWLLATCYFFPSTKKGAEDPWEFGNYSISCSGLWCFFAMGYREIENGQG